MGLCGIVFVPRNLIVSITKVCVFLSYGKNACSILAYFHCVLNCVAANRAVCFRCAASTETAHFFIAYLVCFSP